MKAILSITAAALLAGCGSISYSTGTSQLSRSLVESRLVKGKTTKADVTALLGEPQSTTSGALVNAPGAPAEIWTYTKTFHRDSADKNGVAGSFARYAVTGSMYDRIEVSVLMITFDKSGRVMGHTFSTSAAGAAR